MASIWQENKGAIIAAIGTVAGAIIGAAATLYLQLGHKPDLPYDEFPYYRMADVAVASVKLENFGGSDAQDIKINAEFPKPLAGLPQTGNVSRPLKGMGLGIREGQDTASVQIDALAPGQTVYVYFPIQAPANSRLDPPRGFIKEITIKDGMGETGRPRSWWNIALPILSCLFAVASFWLTRALVERGRKLGYAEAILETQAQVQALKETAARLEQQVVRSEETFRTIETKVSATGAKIATLEAAVINRIRDNPNSVKPSSQ